MAESSEGQTSEKISAGVDVEMSVEDIDQVLAEEDPEFLKHVNQVAADKDLSLPVIEISDEDQVLNDEKEAWAKSGRFKKILVQTFPMSVKVSVLLKKKKFKLIAFFQSQKVRVKNFLYFLATTGRERLTEVIRRRATAAKEKMDRASTTYRYMPVTKKIVVLGTLGLTLATGAFIYRSFTHGFFNKETSLFIPSLADVADQVYEVKPDEEREPFYDNIRFGSHLLLVPKITVNLRRSAKSSPNPMGAFEFYIEGTNQDVLIEIKDRETELRDLMFRTIEDFTFEQVDSPEGKELLADKLRKEINGALTQGKVRKVWIKTVIAKP